MDKQILLHKKFVQAEIARVAKIPDETSRKSAARELAKFHQNMTRNFQHERLIHLIITLFFAILALITIAAFATWFIFSATFSDTGDSANLVTVALFLLAILLTVLEGFYIRYYYRLENRTEKLYKLDREIYDLMQK
jgi:uncharacterized membrane protein (DUF485 family)